MPANSRLKHERKMRGWSQARLAEQIDSDTINVSRWERGFSSPSPYFREKLCLLFGKTAQELGLLPGEEPLLPLQETSPLASEQQQEIENQESSLLSSKSRLFASLSYSLWWISALSVVFLNRDNRFVLFHSMQSLLLFGAITIVDIVLLTLLSSSAPEVVLLVIVLVFAAVNILAVVTWIVGMIKAGAGAYYELLIVGKLSKKITTMILEQRRF